MNRQGARSEPVVLGRVPGSGRLVSGRRQRGIAKQVPTFECRAAPRGRDARQEFGPSLAPNSDSEPKDLADIPEKSVTFASP